MMRYLAFLWEYYGTLEEISTGRPIPGSLHSYTYRSIPKGRPTEICRESLEVKYSGQPTI
jgi:hypothetical protein